MKTMLGLVDVNCSFKLGDLSPELKDFLLTVGYAKTDGKYPEARMNGYLTSKLFNDSTVLGLRIYKDCYRCVDLVYPCYNCKTYYEGQENPEVGYTSVQLGYATKNSIDMHYWSDRYFIPTIEWLEKHPQVKFEDLEKELDSHMNGNYKVIEDLDALALEEALECGDLEAIWDIAGDRDLCELI